MAITTHNQTYDVVAALPDELPDLLRSRCIIPIAPLAVGLLADDRKPPVRLEKGAEKLMWVGLLRKLIVGPPFPVPPMRLVEAFPLPPAAVFDRPLLPLPPLVVTEPLLSLWVPTKKGMI